MSQRNPRTIARLILVGFAALCAGWILRLDFSRKISTNVLDLLPTAERSPDAALVRSLAGDAQARVMLFSLSDVPASPVSPEVAAQFAALLLKSGVFAEAVPLGDTSAQNEMGRAIFDRRFSLLLPSWLGQMQRRFAETGKPAEEYSSWLAEHAAAELENFLTKPEALPMQDLVQADPLLLVPGLLERSRELASVTAPPSGEKPVWALIHDSPLAEAGQQPVFTAIKHALAELRATHPTLQLRWTGVNRFAAASRTRIEKEFGWLNLLSVAAVLLVGGVFVRRVWQMLHLVPVILLSLLGAWTISTVVYNRLHILVFVIGALLSGVAIDYGFYIYMQPWLGPDETYSAKLGRLLKPLLASCLTTVIGFSLLMFSDLPLLREVGFFVGVGLLCALGAAMLYFGQLRRPLLETRRFDALETPAGARVLRPVGIATLTVAVVAAIFGLQRLQWRDDVHDLEIPSPELHANDRALRSAFGDSAERTGFITHGPTVAAARDNLEKFLAYTAARSPSTHAITLGTAFPTEADWRAQPSRLAELKKFPAEFREALARHGFEPASFGAFFSSWEKLGRGEISGSYDELYRELQNHLHGPLALLFRANGPLCWFLTLVDEADAPVPPATLHTVPVNQLESLNGLFTRHRWSALRLSLVGLAMVIASVFAIYRGRHAVRIAIIPAGSCFLIFGLFGLFGQTLNLFHLLGAFLGVCLSHNYAIFSSSTAGQGAVPPSSIRLSALCTAASFGVLGLSHIPVIHALGITVALIVLTALLTVEWEAKMRIARA